MEACAHGSEKQKTLMNIGINYLWVSRRFFFFFYGGKNTKVFKETFTLNTLMWPILPHRYRWVFLYNWTYDVHDLTYPIPSIFAFARGSFHGYERSVMARWSFLRTISLRGEGRSWLNWVTQRRCWRLCRLRGHSQPGWRNTEKLRLSSVGDRWAKLFWTPEAPAPAADYCMFFLEDESRLSI